MTHANIQKTKQLIADVLCISSRMGAYHASVSFFGATENMLIDIYKNSGQAHDLFKTYRLGMNDADFEEKADLVMRDLDLMARDA
ncbi:MAG: hypothetical protein WCP73_03685 [Eubacteriales bacterium]